MPRPACLWDPQQSRASLGHTLLGPGWSLVLSQPSQAALTPAVQTAVRPLRHSLHSHRLCKLLRAGGSISFSSAHPGPTPQGLKGCWTRSQRGDLWPPLLSPCPPGPLRVTGASQVALVVKNPPANAGDTKRLGSIPGSGRSPGGGHGNPFQYSCLENSRDRGALRATVHGAAKSQTCLKRLSTHGVQAGGM